MLTIKDERLINQLGIYY